jgi:hypothetical protein
VIEVPDEKELLEEELAVEALQSEEFQKEEPDEAESRGRRFLLKFISVITFLAVLVGALSIGIIASFNSLLTSEEEIMVSWEEIQALQAQRRDLLAEMLELEGREEVPVDLMAEWRRAQSAVDEGASFSDEVSAQPAADRLIRRVISTVREAVTADESGRCSAILDALDNISQQLGIERQLFNEKVALYRNYLDRLPTRWVAGALRFQEIPEYRMNVQ